MLGIFDLETVTSDLTPVGHIVQLLHAQLQLQRNEERSNYVQKAANVVVLEAPSTISSSLAEATAIQVEQTVDK